MVRYAYHQNLQLHAAWYMGNHLRPHMLFVVFLETFELQRVNISFYQHNFYCIFLLCLRYCKVLFINLLFCCIFQLSSHYCRTSLNTQCQNNMKWLNKNKRSILLGLTKFIRGLQITLSCSLQIQVQIKLHWRPHL